MPARGAPWGREDGTCSAAVLSSGSAHTRGVIEDTDFSARQSSSTSLPQGLGLSLFSHLCGWTPDGAYVTRLL